MIKIQKLSRKEKKTRTYWKKTIYYKIKINKFLKFNKISKFRIFFNFCYLQIKILELQKKLHLAIKNNNQTKIIF